jgi:hypothetical protein
MPMNFSSDWYVEVNASRAMVKPLYVLLEPKDVSVVTPYALKDPVAVKKAVVVD